MRIISGEFKGRIIKTPSTDKTRPMADKTRESLFNVVSNFFDFYGSAILDLYAGSGSIGFECLSRGASYVCFVENGFTALKTLRANAEALDVFSRVKIIKMEAGSFVKMKTDEQYDIIFADPPFFKKDIFLTVKRIFENNILKNEGSVIIQRSIQTAEEDEKCFQTKAFKRIGDSLIYKITEPPI